MRLSKVNRVCAVPLSAQVECGMWSVECGVFESSLRLASLATSLIEGGKVPLGEGAGLQWRPLSRRLRSADRAGRRDDVSVADRGRAKLTAQTLRRNALDSISYCRSA